MVSALVLPLGVSFITFSFPSLKLWDGVSRLPVSSVQFKTLHARYHDNTVRINSHWTYRAFNIHR